MKKFTSAVLAFAMLLSATLCSTSASALDTSAAVPQPNVTVVNLSENATAQKVQEIVDSTMVGFKRDDGSIIPVESVITIDDVSVPTYAGRMTQDENVYQVTVSAIVDGEQKRVSDSDKKNNDNVVASATLKMVWIDGPGLQNAIRDISGTLSVTKGTVTSAVVRWGEGTQSALQWESRDVTGKAAFGYLVEYQAISPKADYTIDFKGESWPLYMCVASSIFQ